MKLQNPRFGGKTEEQLLRILENVASTMDIARQICLEEAGRCDGNGDQVGGSDPVYTLYSLEKMLSGVGALADSASGCTVIGDLPEWMCGSSYRDMAATEPEQPSHPPGQRLRSVPN
jgi:hypothetical protein